MAITKSAKKAIRQNKKNRKLNLVYINAIKKTIKEVRNLTAQKKVQEAKTVLAKAFSALDKAAKVGVVKKNNASRRKSRLAKLIEKNSK